MFVGKNQVRMHDMDMAGLLYFPRQFRFVHDTLEDFMSQEGMPFETLFYEKDFMFVIVHCESDYFHSMRLGDDLEVHMVCKEIGRTSFTLSYQIYREDGLEVGRAKTVHVTIDKKNRKKIPIPKLLKDVLMKHYSRDS
ncbi:Thioesterase [Waddlia chondrophila 2032/99]|uniref:Thioesterase n=2 Tax=Waddlia chondrophila TaxID=71667 RepID=D6YUM1_WADCW|nr:thioesterase family protein [Waddlia chondrophila]ADI37832.1 thioesterase [Waddlia chondrophila WSU 86-1044]CCB91996.1 Thioesterase [Waddlia chondrophila 2032/99]